MRAIEHALTFGANDLPLMGSGDWNDGLSNVGIARQGRKRLAGLFPVRCPCSGSFPWPGAKTTRRWWTACRSTMQRLSAALDAHAWDGQWYRRATFDDGTPLGSSESTECRIDSLPQSWSVLSEATQPARRLQALDSAIEHLVNDEGHLVQLFAPPFDVAPQDPGYIKAYIPGVRENGGQYTHAAVWMVMALAKLHRTDQAWKLMSYINPIPPRRQQGRHRRLSGGTLCRGR